MKKNLIKLITRNAIVAAMYFSLSMIMGPFSFGVFQIRLAEFLVLLCFLNKDYIIGVSVGCLLANLLGNIFGIGNLGTIDIIFGTVATILSCLCVSLMKQLFLSSLIPVVFNGFIIGTELYLLMPTEMNYFVYVGLIALGEFIAVSVIGYLLMKILIKNERFLELVDAKQNIIKQ